MSKYLFDGLPPKVVTYIKVHLRQIYLSGLFDSQEREDLIQDLVLFYLELVRQRCNLTDDYLFISIKTKAQKIIRTRLREMQAGFLNKASLNSMSEDEGFEPVSEFSWRDIESMIELNEIKRFLSKKEQEFIDLVVSGESVEETKKKLRLWHDVMANIRAKIKNAKKNEKK